jgi:hypothetical protein
MEMFIILVVVAVGLFGIGMFLIFQDKNRYINYTKKEIKRIEANNYKGSQEYLGHKKEIEELGLVEASTNQLFNIKQETMKKLNVPTSFFHDEKIYDSEKDYLLKFAVAHGYDNNENIDAIDEKIDVLMGFTLDERMKA